MSFSAQYPPVLTTAGDLTSEVLAKYNKEFQYLYTNLLSALFSATTGHAHTGNGSDGAKITTAALVDNAVTTAKILDANVTTAKIADGAVTASKLATDVLSAIYPVGSIYMSVISTSPATLFGGTWERIQDRFLLAAGSYGAGTIGGEATHTLTIDEMPSHNHTSVGTTPFSGYGLRSDSDSDALPMLSATGSTGGGAAHNNMPPYLAVYMWKRTA